MDQAVVCGRRGNPRSGGWVIQIGSVVGSGVTFVLVLDTGAPFILLLTVELVVCLLPSNTSKDLIGWLGVTCGNSFLMMFGGLAGSYGTLRAAQPGPGKAAFMSLETKSSDLRPKGNP